jgi:hypothetical protein
VTLDHVRTVERSWASLRRSQGALLEALARRFAVAPPSPIAPDVRARWMVAATAELVGLLRAPSQLADRARAVGDTWPDPRTAPCFAVEGRAWLDAAADCLPTWSAETEAAWRQAWLLLSEVLAAETLSPFASDADCGR